mgnify:FL=1
MRPDYTNKWTDRKGFLSKEKIPITGTVMGVISKGQRRQTRSQEHTKEKEQITDNYGQVAETLTGPENGAAQKRGNNLIEMLNRRKINPKSTHK